MAHLLISTNNADHYNMCVYLITNTGKQRSLIKFDNDDIFNRGRYSYAFIAAMKYAVKECNELGLDKSKITFKDYKQEPILLSKHKISICHCCAGRGIIVKPIPDSKTGRNSVTDCLICHATGMDVAVTDFSNIRKLTKSV